MKKLVLKGITATKQTIRYRYEFDGAEFERGHDFDDTVNFDGFADDPTFVRLLSYTAIADSIYTFGLGYFNQIELPFSLNEKEQVFFDTVFLHGLAEFRYVNNLPIHQGVTLTWKDDAPVIASGVDGVSRGILSEQAYVLNGGGKDGAVAIEMAKKLGIDLAWFTSGSAESRSRMVAVSGVTDWTQAHRFSDGYIKANAVLKGHRPMSFYVSMIASLTAYVNDRRYVIAANEYSASFPNLTVDGFAVNHQYSKSSAYEEMLSDLFVHVGIPTRYFSITRPLYELQIMRIFANFTKYHQHFLSCNRGMRDDEWCMNCAKCAFVIGAMYLYNQPSATQLWGEAQTVFASNHLVDELIELVNVDAKPLECIGTIGENRVLVTGLVSKNLITLTGSQQAHLDQLLAAGSDVEVVDLDEYDRPGYFPAELAGSVKEVIKEEMERVLS